MNRTLLTPILLLAAACGGDDGPKQCGEEGGDNFLDGSFCDTADGLEFEAVEVVFFETANSLQIQYGFAEGDGVAPRLDVQLSAGGLMLSGGNTAYGPELLSVRRFTGSSATPQSLPLSSSSQGVVLERFDGAGEECRGRIEFLIDSGTRQSTLRGAFRVSSVVDGDALFGG